MGKKASTVLDLSALSGGFDDLSGGGAEGGKPLELSLDLVIEDPDNRRTAGNAGFSEASLAELAASIIASGGLKTPISVKSADENGMHMINHGARRYRASLLAGMTTIRAFIDDAHDDYDQVIENIQREALEPMEIALFISQREEAGDKPGEIATRLGKKGPFVSRHKALLKMPGFLLRLYEEKGYKNVEGLYELTKASKSHMEKVETFVEGRDPDKLTLTAIRDFLKKVEGGEEAPKTPAPGDENPTNPGNEAAEGSEIAAKASAEAENGVGKSAEPTTTAAEETTQQAPSPAPIQQEAVKDHSKIKKAIVQVQHDERPARVMLDKRAAYGVVWIKYDDDGHEVEVAAETVALVAITEGA